MKQSPQMRILYDHQVFSLQNVGGVSLYFYELTKHLSQRNDVSVDVGLGFNGCVYPFDSLAKAGTRIVGWKTNLRAGLPRYALNEAVTGAWSIGAGGWDIYHSTLYRKMPTVRARRIVATNHDCTHERFPELFDDAKRVIDAKRRLYDMADAIICVSESSRSDLMRFYNVDRQRTHVVHLGLPHLQRDAEASLEFRKALKRPYLLFVGARHTYKNFAGLLKSYAMGGFSKVYDLVVVGGGSLTGDESDEIQHLGISGSVLHWNFVSESVLAEAYSGSELFVSPSFYEGFGLPPLEALSLGCAVLAANTSSVPEICGDAATYFDPLCAGDLERGLREALNDPDRDRRRALGIERAGLFKWQTTAAKTFEIYRAL